jgi:DNA-binding MarR family transcriptional regulator
MTSPSDLTDHVGYWLRLVSNHVSHAFGRRVETTGVTVAEWVVLRALYDHNNLAPSALAVQLGLTRGAISKLADRLIAKGLVARHVSEADRRYQSLTILPPGRELVPQLSALADDNDSQFFAPLSEAERAELIRLMQVVVRHNGLKSTPIE